MKTVRNSCSFLSSFRQMRCNGNTDTGGRLCRLCIHYGPNNRAGSNTISGLGYNQCPIPARHKTPCSNIRRHYGDRANRSLPLLGGTNRGNCQYSSHRMGKCPNIPLRKYCPPNCSPEKHCLYSRKYKIFPKGFPNCLN